MNRNEIKTKSIIQIFNEMDYEEKVETCNPEGSSDINLEARLNELRLALKITKEVKSLDSAVDAAVKAQNKWKNYVPLERANSLHKIWKTLEEISKSKLSKLKNEVSTVVDYVDFYSDLAIQTEYYGDWKPYGVVLIVLSDYSPFFVLGATVSAALASGCSVVVLTPERIKIFSLFLEELIHEVGLPEGLFNVVTGYDVNDIPISKQINKVFFCGSYSLAQKLYKKSLAKSFSFICPGNTSALILESCDLDAAVDKIIKETWGKNPFFAVTNVVVQESIEKKFIEKLKDRVEQFLNENMNDSKFKDKIIAEKINKKIFDALKAGASVEKCNKYEKEIEWSPTILVNYQDKNFDEEIPIIKVSVFRTAKEGVALINNCHYGLGTSVWSEIYSQALEISFMLISPNIWINCHGVCEAGETFQSSGISGYCKLGGTEGFLEFISFQLNDPMEWKKSEEDKSLTVDKMKAAQLGISAHQSFNIWKNIKDRKKYFKEIAFAMTKKSFVKLSEMISVFAHLGNIINFSKQNSTKEFLVIHKKIPIGVILLVVNTKDFDINSIISLIVPAMAYGNAVILVLKEENVTLRSLIELFNHVLPKNLFIVTVGMNFAFYLASDPNIQAIWLYEESSISAEFFQTIKTYSSGSLKHIWIIPTNISPSEYLLQKECLQNKVVWMTKVDQFP